MKIYFIIGTLISIGSRCYADSTNKRMILPGARAQALGGAYTAVADDASAGWYNPAGLAVSQGPGININVNNYTRFQKNISGVDSQSKLTENSSSLYPGFTGGKLAFGPLALGWSYFTADQQSTDESQSLQVVQADNSTYRYSRSNLTNGNLIYAGGSLAFALSKYFSLGVSEFYYRHSLQTTLKERSSFANNIFYDSYIRQSTLNEGVTTVLGVMSKFDAFSIGASVRIPQALSDQTTTDLNSVIYTGNQPELGASSIVSHRNDEPIVRTWTLGLAWTPTSWITFSFDGILYPATTTPWPDTGGYDTKKVTDYSAGVELKNEHFILGGGFFTNSSLVATPVPSLTTPPPARTDFVGLSLGTGLVSQHSETMMIMVQQKGVGKTQLVQSSLSLEDVTIDIQSFSISSRYKF